MKIEILGVHKSFGPTPVLENISLTIPSGKLVALLGPSGSGKTTLLRLIAGLDHADSGRILFDSDDVSSVPPGQRKVGFVFQHYALFGHLDVARNISFGLDVRPAASRPSRAEIAAKVRELIGLVQLDGLASRLPRQLSGGQRQRVALARALAVDPRVLLLDEPFGALDARVRRDLRRWLRELHERVHLTTVFVTHDQEEALEIADEVVVLHEGRVQQAGTPDIIYHRPANEFVHRFLGTVNEFPEGDRVRLVRPHDILLAKPFGASAPSHGTVVGFHSAGPVAKVYVKFQDREQPLLVELSQREFRSMGLAPGDAVATYVLAD